MGHVCGPIMPFYLVPKLALTTLLEPVENSTCLKILRSYLSK